MDVASPLPPPVAADVKDAVERLGGRLAVADLCDVTGNAVGNWCTWGVFPPRLYLRLARAAEASGIIIPDRLFGERKAVSKSGEAA